MKLAAADFSPKTFGIIHFSGIGGIGMSGIAEILHNLGCSVQGSDLSDNANVKRLKALGIKIFIGQEAENITADISVLVRSSAVKDQNAEVVAARKNNIPVIARADMLKEIMHLKKCVTIAGTHGKTTTTSMVTQLFETAGLKPTVVNGGILNSCNTNAYLGSGEWLVAEADESDGSFNKLPANVAVVTNIDPEHMEFYGNFANLRQAFKNFVETVPFYGFAVMCYDHLEVRNLISEITDRKILSYGLREEAQVTAHNLRIIDQGVQFDVTVKIPGKEQEIKDVLLPMFGKHNVLNALAALTIAVEFNIDTARIKQAFAEFLGVKRRLTITGQYTPKNITIIDDYGHHPTEIKASLKAVKEMQEVQSGGRVIAVVQPHRYSRVYDLFNEFSHAFTDADLAYVTEIYAAGEQPITGIDRDALVTAINENKVPAYGVQNLNNLAAELYEQLQENDIVICLGAGDITKAANDLPQALIELNNAA